MKIEVVEELGSTQDELLTRVRRAAGRWPHLSGLRAEAQSAGRGRGDRAWDTSGVRALTVSYVLRPRAPVAEWGAIALRAGVAVVQALAARGLAAQLKWPNDVVIETDSAHEGWAGVAKVGGILGTIGEDDRGARVCIVGIGLNLEGEVAVPTAASLGTGLDAHELAHEIQRFLARLIPGDAPHLPEIDSLMAQHCHTLGQDVVVSYPHERPPRQIRGRAVRIDPDGALVLGTDRGEERVISGDVGHTRLVPPVV